MSEAGGVGGTGDAASALDFPDGPKLELDGLIDRLVASAREVQVVQGRLRALLRAVDAVGQELSLPVVLRSVVAAAAELADARYAALGVVAPDGGLEQFVHVGMSEDDVAAVGHLPEGKGLLGALVTDPTPIRLDRMADDPRSVGFPPGHPDMTSFLGVPVRLRGEPFGNLYLADSRRGAFSEDDQQLVTALANAAGTAIGHARLYEESRRQHRWLQASAEIAAQLLAATGEDPLQTIARRAFDLADADLGTIALVSDDRSHLVVEAALGEPASGLVGRSLDVDDSLAGRVVRSGAPLILDDAGEAGHAALQLGAVLEAGPVMIAPLGTTTTVRGTLAFVRRRGRRSFTPADLAMATDFASHASVALELADARESEQRLLLLEDRDRIARDLHDHVIQELFAIGLGIEGMATRLGEDDPVAQRLIGRADDIDRVIRRIRTTIFALRGALATESAGGLRSRVLDVVTDLADPLGFTPHVAFAGLVDLHLDPDLTDDVLACVREALTNVAKHARASSVSVDIASRSGELVVTVTDDGVGMPTPTRASGTANLRARAERRGGSFSIAAGPAGGTQVQWKVPSP